MSDGFTFVPASTPANAPNIEAGLYDARWDGVEQISHPDWAGKGKFGKDDGERFHWSFTLLDSDGDVIYEDGDPVELEAVTNINMNVLSKTVPRGVGYLKALMTPEEFAAFVAGGPVVASNLVGRKVQLQVIIKDNGWPAIENVLPGRVARKAKGAIKPATAQADAE
jgi:hypothetical protein